MNESPVIKMILFDERLAVHIPSSFQAMDIKISSIMFPYEERPQIILEESITSRFCTFSYLKNQALAEMQVEYAIRSISNIITSLFPRCLLQDAEISRTENRICGWFAYQTFGKEGALHNVMYIMPVDGRMLLGTTGCSINDEEGKNILFRIFESLELPKRVGDARIKIDLPHKSR